MGAPVPAVDMMCQQNDMPMHKTHQTKKSIRKLDLVILPLDSACAPFQDEKGGKKSKQKNKEPVEKDDGKNDEKNDEKRKKKRKAHMDTNATTKPKNLLWKVLACIELKRKTPGRTKGIKSPPSSYTVTDYVPTKPEYICRWIIFRLKTLKTRYQALRRSQQHNIHSTLHLQCHLLASLLRSLPRADPVLSARPRTLWNPPRKKSKMNPGDAEADLDVTVQTGLDLVS
ncbi:hypothetical protein C8R48DRAFT_253453 [Suillus tomentosus]|nr:hypothetical protein C8R48DRAFT_253453 [Suillus tomentosus]